MKPALLLYPFISSYPVLMLLGFVFGWLLARRRSRYYQIQPRHLDNLGLVLPISGLVGARFFARLFYARLPLWEALKVWDGDGLVFYGGFLFSVGAVLLYGLICRVNLVRLCDCLAPSVAVGLAFGRIGCFLAGCCWGDLCVNEQLLSSEKPEVVHQIHTFPSLSTVSWPLAVRFPAKSEPFAQHLKLGLIESGAPESLPVHPVQLYEAALAAILALALHRRFRGKHAGGNAAFALLAGYGVIRFFTEYFRADNKAYWHDLTISQVISVYLLLFCCAALLVRWAILQSRSENQTPSLKLSGEALG